MCTSQLYCVDAEDDSSFSSSSEAISKLETASSSLHSNLYASLSNSSSELFLNHTCTNSPRTNIAIRDDSSCETQFEISNQNCIHPNRTNAANNDQNITHRRSETSTASDHKSKYVSTTYGDICYGEVYFYINTFVSKFTKEYSMKIARFTTIMLPIIVLKMNILFDHMVCLFTLFALRYAASKWIDEKSNTTSSSQNHNQHELSLVSSASDGMSCCSSSLTTTQHSLDHELSPSSTTNCHSKTIDHAPKHDDRDDINLSPATFIPIEQENTADEWGHFTDFEVDIEDSSSGNTGTGTLADPFCSITKSMRRRRGHQLSICKLEQLQEEDEFCDEEW